MPSRKGGFSSKIPAYVIKNHGTDCSTYGENGGSVYIDDENSGNSNNYGNNGLNGQKHEDYYPEKFNVNFSVK